MHEIGYDSTSTMFLSISRQKLATTPSLLTALFMCHQLQTLRLVVIDKVHLCAQHGRSFREMLRIPTTVFFAVIFRFRHWYHLFLVVMTNMTLELLPSFSELTTVDWSLPQHQMWSNWQDFQQRNIKLNFEVVDYMARAYPTLMNHLRDNPNLSAFFFLNIRSKCDIVSCEIEEIIIEQCLQFDKHIIHGNQDSTRSLT